MPSAIRLENLDPIAFAICLPACKTNMTAMKLCIPKFAFYVACLGIFAGCASQSDIIVLDERLKIIERSNQVLNRENIELKKKIDHQLKSMDETSQTTETTLRSKYAGLNANLDSIGQELRLASGRIDEISHKLDGTSETFDTTANRMQDQVSELKLTIDQLEKRLVVVEKYLNLNDSKSKASKKTPKSNKPAGGNTNQDAIQQLYDSSKQAFDNGQIDAARQGFQRLLKEYPKSTMADNAQYWIGETYFREKWFEKAILEYQAVIENYPKGNKVAAAMLKQGMAFVELGDKSNARLILQELVKKYPGSSEAKIGSKKLADF